MNKTPPSPPTFWQRFCPTARMPILGPLLGLALVVLLFSLHAETREYFLTGANAKQILTQTVIVGIAAIGMTLIIVGGGIDLSVGSIVAFTSLIAAWLLREGWSLVPVVVAAVSVGGVMGCLNGIIIARLQMNPFIVTLGMMGVARGMTKWVGNNQTVNYPDHPLNLLMTDLFPGTLIPPIGVGVMAVLAVVMIVVMNRTVPGRQLFALGSNEAAARLCGIPTVRVKWMIYAVGGLFYGIAGLMQMARLGQGDPIVATGMELDVIAAVVIGGGSLYGGAGSVAGSLIGALIMAVLRNGSNQMGWPSYTQEIVIGSVIVLAVFLDRLRQNAARKE